MERHVNLSYVAVALIVLACLTFGFLGGGLVGGVAGYAMARYQCGRAAQVPRPITPPQIEPEEIAPFDFIREAQPYLGVHYQTITPELAEKEGLLVEQGALVREVIPDGPAEDAGLQELDIITAVDDQAVDDDHPLDKLIQDHEAGDQVELTVLRERQERSLKVKLGARHEYFFRFPPEGFPEMPPEGLPLPPLEND